MNEASIPDEVTFPLIQPLIQSAAQRGTRLTCVFECPVSSKTASATVDILQANDNAFATKARARVTAAAAKSVSRSVGRTLRGLFGNNVVGKLAGEFANDKTKGLVSVRVAPLAPCASEEGATVTLDPPGAAQLRYVSGSIPREGQAAVKAGESISVIFYNVEPGVKVRPVVTHPSCEVVPFPVAVGDVSYTNAEVTPEPGEVLTFVRTYVGPPKAVDAGTD